MARLTKDKSTPDNRAYWNYVETTAAEVRSWPAWKRGECSSFSAAHTEDDNSNGDDSLLANNANAG